MSQTPPGTPLVTSVDHLVIGVRDLAAATESYRRLLGLEPSWRGTHPAYGTANTLFRIDNLYVELLAPVSAGPIADDLRARFDAEGEGLVAIVFGTADAAATSAALAARGLHPTPPQDGTGREATSGAERSWRNVFLPESDTRGVRIFLIEHRSAPDLLPLAQPTGSAASAVSACDHIVVQSTDPDAAIALYGKTLGLRLALDRTAPEWGMRLLFFRVAGVTVEITSPLGEHVEKSATDRLWGISWRVPDVGATHARLAASGVAASEIRKGRRPGTRVFTVQGETHGVATLVLGPE
jgi:catechol 2,3-dioxygenase-like lactoylglutathione lyase family enzyme